MVTTVKDLKIVTTQLDKGLHAYKIGEIVHYPDINGQLWRSKINANTTKPDGDVPYNRYWEPYK